MDTRELVDVVAKGVIVPVLIAIVPFIVTWLKARSDEIKERTKSEELRKYVDIAEGVVADAVITVARTYVDALKKEGAFDEAAQRVAFNEARTKVVAVLGLGACRVLSEAYGDINEWLENKIEVAVLRYGQGEI